MIGGAQGGEDIEDFGEVHLAWLQDKGLFLNGIPVHDTIARIISRIQPEQFQAAFIRWTQAIQQQMDGALITVGWQDPASLLSTRRSFIDYPHGQRLRRRQQTGARSGENR